MGNRGGSAGLRYYAEVTAAHTKLLMVMQKQDGIDDKTAEQVIYATQNDEIFNIVSNEDDVVATKEKKPRIEPEKNSEPKGKKENEKEKKYKKPRNTSSKS